MAIANNEAIDRALEILSGALGEFIDSVGSLKLPPETDWRRVLVGTAGSDAVLAQLRVLTEPFESYGYICEDDLSGAAMRLAGEVQRTLEAGGRPELAAIERFLRALGASDRAYSVSQLGKEPDVPVEPVPVSVDEPQVVAELAPVDAPIEEPFHEPDATAEKPVAPAEPVAAAHGDPKAIQIEIAATDVLSYAVAHNRVPVIRQLTIRNLPGAVQGAVLRIALRDADGAIGAPKELLVDLEPESETVLNSIGFELDPAAMLQIEEQRPGKIHVELVSRDAVIAAAEVPVRVLAANQWLASPLSLGLEMLAAFVMPNHPSVTALMGDVATRLQRTTGSDSIQGYQAGPERVDQIVAAIFAELHARGIRYSEPPASWADTGQKVRTPGDVLDGRVGTCLDTVVVMAAALEQAGIRPLLWVVEGHAFLGYWREEHSLAVAAQTDAGDVVNLIDLGLIRLVETTLLTSGGAAASMDVAHQDPYGKYLTGHLERVHGITDVYRARRDGILPLPARRRDAAGNVVVTEYRPVDTQKPYHPPAAVSTPVDRNAPARTRTPIPPRVAQWKNRLLDLSLRNRLINFTDSARMSLAVPGDHLPAFEDAINQGTPFHLLPSDQISAVHRERGIRYGRDLPPEQVLELLVERKQVFIDLTESVYLSRLRALAYGARTLIEETGSNNLYLAFGSLLWNVDNRPLRSPLILVPVQLTAPSRGGVYRLTLDESGASTPNYCLLEKLRQEHGLEIPELQEPKEDGAGIDLRNALQATREALAKRGLPFRVEPTADLAILQFAKFRLWKDLDENWEQFSENSLVRHLIQTPNEPYLDPIEAVVAADLDQLAAVSPMPADSSQLAAVAEANAGRSFVLEGPPGTGKSQTITNLLTRAIVEGKRVLFVAEKRAALEVVRKRLDEVGVGEFCLDLHDKGSSTNEVRAQIRKALDHAVEVDTQGMETDLDLLSSARGSLVRYARRLHEKNPAGLSFYSARTQELAIGDSAPSLPVSEQFIANATPELMTKIRGLLAALPDLADPAHPQPHHPWGFIDSPASLNLDAVRSAATELDAALAALPGDGPLSDVLRTVKSAEDLAALYTLLNGPRLPLATIDEAGTPLWQQTSAAVSAEIAAFGTAAHPGLESVTIEAFQLPLQQIHDAALAAEDSGFFGRGKRIDAVRDQLAPVLRPGVDLGKHPSELTTNLVPIQREIQRLSNRVAAVRGVALPAGWNPLTAEGRSEVDRQIAWLRWAGLEVDLANAGARADFVQAVRVLLQQGSAIDPDLVRALGRASATAQRFSAECRLAPGDLAGWADSAGLIARWRETGTGRRLTAEGLPTLQTWLRLLEHLEPLRGNHLNEGRHALLRGGIEADEAVRAFDRGLAEASLRERELATGLESFDARNQMRTIERFTRASTAVRDHLLTALPDQVLKARTFDVHANAGQVGQLHRQLSRQRGGMGVRALIANFGELITSIMPCVLVSPDSLSRFFAAKAGLFDIVVFDEASQIRVADAIGAMGRAKSVVVVGDSKQMPPTAFAEPSANEDLIDSALDLVEDEESILSECVQARVPQQWLSWHYRSQDESLIAFSNQQYYESKLSSFPAPRSGEADPGAGGHGVSLIRVNGQFHRTGKGAELRTNPVEAEAVVAEIKRRFAASPDELPSIGVVTFNVQQRNLIEAMLRDSGDPRLIEALDQAADGLFVKNLENVQGDERDTIFFSTAFSVNERGYLPLNFGPLNRGGGERRLNVAITRARRQVVVFTSFDPEQLRADETSSVGIKHLRAYLDVAAQGTKVLPHAARRRTAPDRHREEIAEALRERGYAVRTDVGLSDFKIDLSIAAADDPERRVMAVLLDGPQWASRRTVGDRDGLPTEVLSRMLRWPSVQRIWMPAWLADRETVLNELEAAFNMAVERMKQPVAAPSPTPIEVDPPLDAQVSPDSEALADLGVADPDDAGTLATAPIAQAVTAPPAHVERANGAEPFAPWPARTIGTLDVLDALPSPRPAQMVAAALQEIVEFEGPIHVERLVRLVAGSFGLGRVSEARHSSIVRYLDPESRRDPGEPFAWPDTIDPLAWTGYRPTPAGIDRPIEQISKREIVNAMAVLCHGAMGMSHDELKREALRVFGGKRMTTNISTILDEAIALGLSSGRLKNGASGLIVVK